MKEFEVTITETLQKSITVEAATREEAQAMVEEMWDKLLQDLQSRNERMFLLTFLVLNVAETKGI